MVSDTINVRSLTIKFCGYIVKITMAKSIGLKSTIVALIHGVFLISFPTVKYKLIKEA